MDSSRRVRSLPQESGETDSSRASPLSTLGVGAGRGPSSGIPCGPCGSCRPTIRPVDWDFAFIGGDFLALLILISDT